MPFDKRPESAASAVTSPPRPQVATGQSNHAAARRRGVPFPCRRPAIFDSGQSPVKSRCGGIGALTRRSGQTDLPTGLRLVPTLNRPRRGVDRPRATIRRPISSEGFCGFSSEYQFSITKRLRPMKTRESHPPPPRLGA